MSGQGVARYLNSCTLVICVPSKSNMQGASPQAASGLLRLRRRAQGHDRQSRLTIHGALTRGLLVGEKSPCRMAPPRGQCKPLQRHAQKPEHPFIRAGSGLRPVASKGRSPRGVSSFRGSLPSVRQIPCRSKTVAGLRAGARGFRGIKPFVSSLRDPLTFYSTSPCARPQAGSIFSTAWD